MDENETLQFLDIQGLALYDELIKKYVDEGDVNSIKYLEFDNETSSIFFWTTNPVAEGAEPQYVVHIPDENEFMALVETAVENDIAIFNDKGQVIDSGKTLGDFATAEQGARADSAVQSITTGETNGTILVDGEEVPVAGLGSAAYTEADMYDPIGSAAAVLGDEDDDSTVYTVYGAFAAIEKIKSEGYDDTELRALINQALNAIDILNGDETVDGSVKEQLEELRNDLISLMATMIGDAGHLKREIVNELPDAAEADELTIYLVPKESGDGDQIYDEYMVIDGKWEKLGDTGVDLTGYVTESDLEKAISDLKEEIDSEITEIESRVTVLESKMDNVETQVEENTEAIEALETSINNIEAIPEEYIRALFDE